MAPTPEVDMETSQTNRPETPEAQGDLQDPQGLYSSTITVAARPNRKRSLFEVITPVQQGRKNAMLDYAAIAKDRISNARNMLIEAASYLEGDENEQSKVLDLLEVFRDYLEKGTRPISSTAKALATQVASLEQASKKITKQARQAEQQQQHQHQHQQHPRRLFSEVTKAGTGCNSTQAQQQPATHQPTGAWTVVQRKRAKPEPVRTRLTFALQNKEQEINPMQLRDSINDLAKKGGFQGILTTAVKKSTKGNLVITLHSTEAKEFLTQHTQIVQDHIPITQILEDNTWYKVAIHGVPTNTFDNPEGPSLLRREIEMFNGGLKVVGTPVWLSNIESRSKKTGGSMLIAFATEHEAQRAIHNRLYIAGVSIRAEKAREKKQNTPSPTPLTEC